ncbi:hypothetical protein HN587_02240 [Candidatus Woesearchaeota archaeon]|jgi:hypothetical protein|nr:hypothetical protein [Candidatus Woesearchaeota archaeon]
MRTELDQIVAEVISSPTWRIHSGLDIIESPGIPHKFHAEIGPTWDITFAYDPELKLYLEQTVSKFYLERVFPTPLKSFTQFVLEHEEGHWSVCPFDAYPFEDVLAGCSKALTDLRMGSMQSRDLKTRNQFILSLKYFINSFEDLVDNVVKSAQPKRGSDYRKGLGLSRLLEFYMAYESAPEEQAGFQPITKTSTAMAELENHLCRQFEIVRNLQQQYYPPEYDQLGQTIQEVVELLVGDKKLAQKALDYKLTRRDHKKIATYLGNRRPGNWYALAYEYTKKLGKLFVKEQEQAMQESAGNQGSQISQSIFPFDYDGNPLQKPQQGQPQEDAPGQGQPQEGEGQPSQGKPQEGEGQPSQGQPGDRDQDPSKNPNDAPGQGDTGQDPPTETPKNKPEKAGKGKNLRAKARDLMDKLKKAMQGKGKNSKPDLTKAKNPDGRGEVGGPGENDETPDLAGADGTKDPKEMPDLVQMLNQNEIQTMAGIGIEKGHPINYATQLTFMKEVYGQRAEKIVMEFLREEREGTVTPIAYLTTEPVTPDNFQVKRIAWHRTSIHSTPQGRKIQLRQKTFPEVIKEPLIIEAGGFPDLAFINDSSGTMKANLLAGTGPYDLLLRGCASVIKYAEINDLAYEMNFAVLNFSGRTYFSGWQPYQNMNVIWQELLRFQNGGTTLNPAKIRQLYEESTHPFVAILTTDGLLSNQDAAAEECKNLVMAGNKLVVIAVKNSAYARMNSATTDRFLEELDDYAEIHVIGNIADLVGIHMGQGKRYWGKDSDFHSDPHEIYS